MSTFKNHWIELLTPRLGWLWLIRYILFSLLTATIRENLFPLVGKIQLPLAAILQVSLTSAVICGALFFVELAVRYRWMRRVRANRQAAQELRAGRIREIRERRHFSTLAYSLAWSFSSDKLPVERAIEEHVDAGEPGRAIKYQQGRDELRELWEAGLLIEEALFIGGSELVEYLSRLSHVIRTRGLEGAREWARDYRPSSDEPGDWVSWAEGIIADPPDSSSLTGTLKLSLSLISHPAVHILGRNVRSSLPRAR